MVARNTAILETPKPTSSLKKRRVVRAHKPMVEPALAKVKATLVPAVVPVERGRVLLLKFSCFTIWKSHNDGVVYHCLNHAPPVQRQDDSISCF